MAFVFFAAPPARAVSSSEVLRLFANPTRDYSTAPFLTFNGELTDQKIIEAMHDLAGQKVQQVIIHPRHGLMTPYLSDEWFRLWALTLKEARRLDMNVWIYDENSYPSGFAGGWVPELMPESRGRGLMIEEQTSAPAWAENIIAVYRLDGERYENVSRQIRANESLPEGRYVVASIERAENKAWFANRCYVDLLYPGVTEKFIEVTLEPYRKRFQSEFGQRIPGSFTDEPLILPTWRGLPWTKRLPELFERRWGYKLTSHLVCLYANVGDYKKVRHNYFQLLLEQFIEHWSKPMHDYCQKYNLEFTGHYWEHEWPVAVRVPDNMAMYAWHQRPAIDTIFNQYSEELGAQFGNIRSVKELASVANQMGRPRTLCETYSAGGWDLRFEDMKRIGDWLYVLGVNTINEHYYVITIRGARKRDHPQTFSYHEPWWEAFHVMEAYLSRLSAALSHGQQVNRILILEPTTSTWMYHPIKMDNPQIWQIGTAFQNLVTACEKAQVEYDLGCEDIIARHGSVDGGGLVIGKRQYDVVVLPPMIENLNARTMELLESFVANGGKVLCCSQPPSRVEGVRSDRSSKVAEHDCWQQVHADEVPALLLAETEDGFSIRQDQDSRGILFHHRRQLDDGQILFVVNTSIENSCSGTIQSPKGGVQQWCPQEGTTKPYPFERVDGMIKCRFQLEPCGSLLLFLSNEAMAPVPAAEEKTVIIKSKDEPQIRRLEPNVLTLDYVEVTVGEETRKGCYCYQAGEFIFQKHGFEHNPWDLAVQFSDELISKTFPADSGFEAGYRFTIRRQVPKSLFIVIERADLYTITCNGQAVKASLGNWWLDKSFDKIDIASVAQVGENVVTIKAAPMTMYHELESAYLLGDFALISAEKGFEIIPQAKLEMGPWNSQGHPFYAAGVCYRERFDISEPSGQYFVSLPKWYGSVAKVIVNGKPAGYITHAPWECEVTSQIVRGENIVEVVVIGTLKNTLGPHHNNPPLGIARPDHFRQCPETGQPPGHEYSTVGYGLFEPFVITQVCP